jgi:hypothetical protein
MFLKTNVDVWHDGQNECVQMDVDVTTNAKWACHVIFDNLALKISCPKIVRTIFNSIISSESITHFSYVLWSKNCLDCKVHHWVLIFLMYLFQS